MELHWTRCPNLTTTRLLSPGIIWFWSQANIPWLDFVIDSARAVKVSQSPGSHTRMSACTRWPSVGIWHTKQCHFTGGLGRTPFRSWCLDMTGFFFFFFLPNHFFWLRARASTFPTLLPVETVAFRALWLQTKRYKADTSRWSGYQCSWRRVCQEWRIFLDRFLGGFGGQCSIWLLEAFQYKESVQFLWWNHIINKYKIQLQMLPHPEAFKVAGMSLFFFFL